MTTQSRAIEIAQKIIGRDILNRRGLFHIIEAKADYSSYHKIWKIEARCSVASHKICADTLTNGTAAMGINVFMLTLEEAEKLIRPSKKAPVKRIIHKTI